MSFQEKNKMHKKLMDSKPLKMLDYLKIFDPGIKIFNPIFPYIVTEKLRPSLFYGTSVDWFCENGMVKLEFTKMVQQIA